MQQYSQQVNISKYSTGALEFLVQHFIGPTSDEDDFETPLLDALLAELEHRQHGRDTNEIIYEVPSFAGQDAVLHVLCHKTLLIAFELDKREQTGPKEFFLSLYYAYLGQLGFQAVDAEFETHEARVVH